MNTQQDVLLSHDNRNRFSFASYDLIMRKNFLKKSIALSILGAVLGTGFACAGAPMQLEATVNFEDKFDFEPHRGGRDARPENTLYAYANAIEMGATSIECDMQLTAEGDIVMSHNPFLNPEITTIAPSRRASAPVRITRTASP